MYPIKRNQAIKIAAIKILAIMAYNFKINGWSTTENSINGTMDIWLKNQGTTVYHKLYG